jgi:hypothetical protein
MPSLFRNLFGRRSRSFNPFRRKHSGLTRTLGNHRGGVALGTLATIAVPFIIRKLRERHAQRVQAGAAY